MHEFMKSLSKTQTHLRLLACGVLFVVLLNAFHALSVCRAQERVNVGGNGKIDCKVQPANEASKDTDLGESRTAPQSATEIKWVKVRETVGTPVDEISSNDLAKPNRNFTEETSVRENRVLGNAALVGDSLLPFLEDNFLTTTVSRLPHTGSEKPRSDFEEQTLVRKSRFFGGVVAAGDSLMPSLKTLVSPEEMMDVAQRVEYAEQSLSVGQNPVLKTELNELESRLCREISGIIGQLTLDIGGVKQVLGRVKQTIPTKEMGEEVNHRLRRIEDSFLRVSDLVQHIESTTPEIENLEVHFTQLREQVASAQAELHRNSQGVVEIGDAFGSRLDELEGILQQVIAKWDTEQSEMAQRLNHLQDFKPDQLNDFNERLGRIEDSFLRVSDQVRHIDSTTPEIETMEAHFTQLREQIASAQAELDRNNQGVVEIGGAFGSRLDELEGILQQVITRWDSGDQLQTGQRIRHLPSVQPGPLTEHKENSQEVTDLRDAFSSRLDELEGMLQRGLAKWGSDQLELAQAINTLQGVRQDPLNDANFQQAGHLEPSKPVSVYAKQHPVFYRPNHFEQTFNGQPVAYWQSQVPPANESENVLQMTILAFKSCVVGVLVTCMVVFGAMMFFVLQKKGHTSETRQH